MLVYIHSMYHMCVICDESLLSYMYIRFFCIICCILSFVIIYNIQILYHDYFILCFINLIYDKFTFILTLPNLILRYVIIMSVCVTHLRDDNVCQGLAAHEEFLGPLVLQGLLVVLKVVLDAVVDVGDLADVKPAVLIDTKHWCHKLNTKHIITTGGHIW